MSIVKNPECSAESLQVARWLLMRLQKTPTLMRRRGSKVLVRQPSCCRLRWVHDRGGEVACYADLGSRSCCLGRRRNNVMLKGGHCGGVSIFQSDLQDPNRRTHPAIPIACGICRLAFSASQYTGVILSIPSRVPTRISVGCQLPSSSTAICFSLSSYTSAPSPET